MQHEQVRHTRDNAPPDASTWCSARIAGVVHAPPHNAITRHLTGRCDLEPQRIGNLLLQRMLENRRATGHPNAIKLQPRLSLP
jgi:hypothetical protein